MTPIASSTSASTARPLLSRPAGEAGCAHLTIGREALIDRLLRSLTRVGEPLAARHQLVVGPPGIGKTQVLRALAAHIDRATDIASAAIVVAPPEQGCPSSVIQLLAAILRELPDDPELGPSVDALRSLQRQRDGDQHRRALELIHTRLRGRRLFILLDRLDELCAVLGPDGRAQLDAVLAAEPSWAVVACARAPIPEVAPELAGFTTHRLAPLTPEQCRELLAHLAAAHGRATLAEALTCDAGLARVRSLHHLLGGTPRAMMLVFAELDAGRFDRTELALAGLGRALGAYLREHSSRLSPSQRGIVELLAESWRPLSVTEIAERSFAKQASTSGALRHLRREGLVRALEVGRERYYELCDPLHRLARPGDELLRFAELLRAWYAKQGGDEGRAEGAGIAELPEALAAECEEAVEILGGSAQIAVGRLHGRLARTKSPVMTAALVLALERKDRPAEALDILLTRAPGDGRLTHAALLRLADALGLRASSTAATMMGTIVAAVAEPGHADRRAALLRRFEQASPRQARVLSDSLLRYPALRAWADAGEFGDLGRLLCCLRPTRTGPALEAELLAVLELGWRGQALARLLGGSGSLDGLLAIASPRLRTALAWAGAVARLDAQFDGEELVAELRRRIGLGADEPTWPTADKLSELGPSARALALALLADPRSFERWASEAGVDELIAVGERLLATGIYAWIAAQRPLDGLVALDERMRSIGAAEVLPPTLLASKHPRETYARLAASERRFVDGLR